MTVSLSSVEFIVHGHFKRICLHLSLALSFKFNFELPNFWSIRCLHEFNLEETVEEMQLHNFTSVMYWLNWDSHQFSSEYHKFGYGLYFPTQKLLEGR